jgi:hypothetical protein
LTAAGVVGVSGFDPQDAIVKASNIAQQAALMAARRLRTGLLMIRTWLPTLQ